jgi:carbamoyl-phosphate synthase large subunit
MPRKSYGKIMIIGSGPIMIGQAAEFDFSGSQAAKSLKEEGYRTVLVNSNPATIQTDVDMADSVYIEPLTVPFLEKIIEKEKPEGILSGMGGQTALNLCSELADKGILEKHGVKLLGTGLDAIRCSEDRDEFRKLLIEIGEPIPRSAACSSVEQAKAVIDRLGGYPVIIRAAYTLGGTGSGIAHDEEELERMVSIGIAYSRIKQVLVEESVLGWKEFEYEVMRDSIDNCITVCNMENLDPMGFHTGESIVVAPAQTLTDRENQNLRDAALRIIRALKIEGGCNIQFAVNPDGRDYRVIEVNPRVSRSSALASKATGYPIARIAAKIAVGLTLDEILNPVTGKTYVSFEPTLDYIITKIPRWPFDKFVTADKKLGTSMKSTGEVMGIGRCFEESLLKAMRSLEIDSTGPEEGQWTDESIMAELEKPTDKRLFAIFEAIRRGYDVDKIASITDWDIFFLEKIRNIVEFESLLLKEPGRWFAEAKNVGMSDETISSIVGLEEDAVRAKRGIRSVYKMVDTCGGEFEAKTPYYYSSYERDGENELKPISKRKVLIVGSGPIRIGQGIEFDCCCVHGIEALMEEGIGALIVNNNPETVSTDFDISDRLYFEPLVLEDVANILESDDIEGVILQFGGQTSINLAVPLQRWIESNGSKTRIMGTSPDSIDIAEDRKRFESLMKRLGIRQPKAALGFSFDEVKELAAAIGYPVLVRPSYVLGGRGMEIIYGEEELEYFMKSAARISKKHPVLVDKYLSHAVEIDVDAVSDGVDVFIGGIQEHIEEAGVHSGDATCVLPCQTLPANVLDEIRDITRKVCASLKIKGLINLQLAVKDGAVYMLEANPRASRSVPYVSKAIGVPMAKLATKIATGRSLKELGFVGEAIINHVAVKAPVFPFQKLPGVDCILGPEMKSTGEVMGIDSSFGKAYFKAMLAAGNPLPLEGRVYVSVKDEDKPHIVEIAKGLSDMGLSIVSTRGTASHLRDAGIEVTTAYKIDEKMAPDALGLMRRGEISLVINTPKGTSGAKRDGYMMRRLAVDLNIPFITTIQAAKAAVEAIGHARSEALGVKPLREFNP